MRYQRFRNQIIVRVDPDEEILEELSKVAAREDVPFAEITGLGGLKALIVSVYDTETKRYYDNSFREALELIQLSGTVTRKDGNPYLHVHASAGNAEGRVFGGHLKRAEVSVTAEIILKISDGSVYRKFDDEIGINLIVFDGGESNV